jgi:hypothetical protein
MEYQSSKAFQIMKALIAQDCMLCYPDHNKPFKIYTDASNYQQLPAWCHDSPRRYTGCLLLSKIDGSTKVIYTTLEKELLSIFMAFKEFNTMLLSATNCIHTNHKNLTYTTSVNDHVLGQLKYIEQFGPSYTHISGEDNFLADMFSHLPRLEDANIFIPDAPSKRENIIENVSFISDDDELLECFLNLPDANDIPFALDLECLAQGQNEDPALWQKCMQHPLQYPEQNFGNTHVLLFQPTPTTAWKICIPTQQLDEVVQWYHLALNHCGLYQL